MGFLRIISQWLCLLGIVGFLMGNGTAEAQSVTREDLEPVLKIYLQGCSDLDFGSLKASMSEAALVELSNVLASRKKEFPPVSGKELSVWDGAMYKFYSFEKLRFVALKERGPRAILTYQYPEMGGSDGAKIDGFLMFDFVREKEGWKLFRPSAVINEKLNGKFTSGDLSFLDDPDFTPEKAEIPALPPTATRADYIAQCQWYIPTGKLFVTVNGVSQEIDAMSGFKLILGGLKKGENKIKIQYDPKPKPDANRGGGEAKVRIKVFSGDKLNADSEHELLVHKWPEGANDFEKTFNINDDIVSQLPKPNLNY
jgi:hypothetical protein